MRRSRLNGYLANVGLGVNILSDCDVEQIHYATLEVLAKTGVYVEGKEALDYFSQAGAIIEDDNIVKIPEHVVNQALSTVPSTLTFYGRDGDQEYPLTRGRTYFTPGKQPPFVNDLKTGKQRPSTLQDVADSTRLVDALEEFDLNDSLCVATDAPVEIHDFCNFAAVVPNTTKYVMTIPRMPIEKLELFMELPYAVAGGEEALRQKPFLMIGTGSISPLFLSEEANTTCIYTAKHGLPMLVGNMCMSGGTGPATLAGTLVVHNAETLATIILGQIVNPGCPVIYGSSLGMLYLKSASSTVGSPEAALLNAASAKLSQFYGIPSITGGG